VVSVVRAVSDYPVLSAAGQVEVFEDMRTRASGSSDPSQIVGYLEYAESYYPIGCKQQPGSPLDRIVAGYRKAVIREIIGRLRTVTGQDLGGQPKPWIEKYRSMQG
jgi:hypothetical protein